MHKIVRMVTLAEHQYAGHRLHAGDEYDCEEQHVSLMQKLGWSLPLTAKKDASDKRRYLNRNMKAED